MYCHINWKWYSEKLQPLCMMAKANPSSTRQKGLQIRMIRASVNRGSRLGPKTSVQGKPCAKPWDMKILQVIFNIRGKILVFSKKCWIPWVSCFYFAFQDISSKKKFSIFFLTDRKNSSPINNMKWWGNFSISQKNFEKFFFAWNVLKHKVKPKNSSNSTFFSKTKISPLFLKNTCKIFKSKM